MTDVTLTFFCPVTKGKVQWEVIQDGDELARQWSADCAAFLPPL